MEFQGKSADEKQYKEQKSEEWKWRFALFPTLVGTTGDEQDVWIWLKFYQIQTFLGAGPGGICFKRRYENYSELVYRNTENFR